MTDVPDPEALLKEVADLPDPQRNLLTHNERELILLCRRLGKCVEQLQKDLNVWLDHGDTR